LAGKPGLGTAPLDLRSDLKDFIELKFIGPDEEGLKKFWGID
jgi:hypothetical protein